MALSAVNATGGYQVVEASQTAKMLGSAGRAGDYLSHIVVTPLTSSPGTVTLIDGSDTVLSITPPASSQPFEVKVGTISKNGAWKLTTGANVSCLASGNFSEYMSSSDLLMIDSGPIIDPKGLALDFLTNNYTVRS